jgi:membrane protein
MVGNGVLRHVQLAGSMLWQSYREWVRDSAARLSAALAYYTALSLAPMSIVLVLIATRVFGTERFSDEMSTILESALGPEVVQFFRAMLRTAEVTGSGYLAGGIGLFAVVYGASRGLMCLRDALNKIFGYDRAAETRQFLTMLVGKLITIGITMLILTAILVLLFLSPFLAAAHRGLTEMVPVLDSYRVLTMQGVTFLIATLFFMIIYRVLPAHRMRWRDVAPGSLFTALLFQAGDAVIRLYLRRSFVTSLFGAAGSFVVVLLWLYFLAQIIFFGAEFTFVYLTRLGRMMPREELFREESIKRPKAHRFRNALGKRPRVWIRAGAERSGPVHSAGQPVIGDGRRHRRRRDRTRGKG